MNVSLTPELEFIDGKVESGLYNNAAKWSAKGFACSKNTMGTSPTDPSSSGRSSLT